jgi:addiction module HigA family antidote
MRHGKFVEHMGTEKEQKSCKATRYKTQSATYDSEECSMRVGNRLEEAAHPGRFVKSKVVEAHGLSVTDAAKALGVTRPALSALLNERSHLSPEMALRIEKAFGVPMDALMRMQNSFDIAQARKREGDIKVSRVKPMAAAR